MSLVIVPQAFFAEENKVMLDVVSPSCRGCGYGRGDKTSDSMPGS